MPNEPIPALSADLKPTIESYARAIYPEPDADKILAWSFDVVDRVHREKVRFTNDKLHLAATHELVEYPNTLRDGVFTQVIALVPKRDLATGSLGMTEDEALAKYEHSTRIEVRVGTVPKTEQP